jgi:glycosyltransferase involved in cell wall biosynthesis
MTPDGSASISVIVRSVGNALRLSEALESLSMQTRSDFEVVLVDMSGGANDAVIANAARALPLRVVTLPRASRPRALNAGIAATSASAIAILDDDNLYDPVHLDVLLRGLDHTGAGYVYTGVRHATFTADGVRLATRDVSRPFVFADLLKGNFIYATGSAYRKSLWQRLGGYDERFAVFEDWDFLIRAAQVASIEHLDVVSGESRKFTGREGVSNFDREIALVRRCHAGIYWKHRRLYFAPRDREMFRAAYADHCSRRQPSRSGLLARDVRGWRLELAADLLAWWTA